ncbi:MAG: MBL fold metallo-hydrolase [Acidobacteriota bacterium]|nr:MBL fold metallo-hydrolase [Acidobacteriota bacterium]
MKKRLLKTIKIAALVLLILIGVLAAIILWSQNDRAVIEKYVRNENLPTVKTDWQGTPLDQKGRFVNHEFPFLPSTVDLLKWQLGAKPQKQEKQNDIERLEVRNPTEFLRGETDGILWLGHAAFFIRLNGVNILLDPIFGEPSFINRLVSAPSPIDKLQTVDFILISHDHRDHCDEETIKQLTTRFPDAKILAGLRMDELLNDWKSPETEIQTAGWYQRFSLPTERVKIFFTPVRHWSRRGLFDTNERLWGGFVIQGAEKTIYFSGDSGYGSHYKELADVLPKIDYFLIGIGAYQPIWFMKANHNSPQEAFQGFVDSKADVLIPMHFGRFDLSDEPPSEPLRLLKEKAAEANLSNKIKNLQINESVNF